MVDSALEPPGGTSHENATIFTRESHVRATNFQKQGGGGGGGISLCRLKPLDSWHRHSENRSLSHSVAHESAAHISSCLGAYRWAMQSSGEGKSVPRES